MRTVESGREILASRLAQVMRHAGDAAWPVPSPCSSVCLMDDDSGYCKGCWRTLEEIAGWSRFDDKTKIEVWHRIKERTA